MTIRQDLEIRQGETWSYVYTHGGASPVDLTGYTARMSVRRQLGGSLEAYLSTGSDANGGTITLGDEAGTVTLAMTATQSTALAGSVWNWHWMDEAGLTVGSRDRASYERTVSMIYDLEIVSDADVVTRVLEGRLLVHRQVTE